MWLPIASLAFLRVHPKFASLGSSAEQVIPRSKEHAMTDSLPSIVPTTAAQKQLRPPPGREIILRLSELSHLGLTSKFWALKFL